MTQSLDSALPLDRPAGDPELDVGRTISSAVRCFAARPAPFVVTGVAYGLCNAVWVTFLGSTTDTQTVLLYYGLGFIALMVADAVIAPIAICLAVDQMKGRRTPVSEALVRGLQVAPTAFVVLLLYNLGTSAGYVLLIIPGIMLVCRWIAALPIQVIEQPGPLQALGRSAKLTEGVRLKIFGFLLIFGAIMVVCLVISELFKTWLPPVDIHDLQPAMAIPFLAETLATAIMGVASQLGFSALYVELKRTRGDDVEAISTVFD